MKLYIATPAYDSKVFVDYLTSLIATLKILETNGIAYDIGVENGDCYVAKARNKLTRKFLESDCTHLLFIDADVGWDADKIMNVISSDYDVCLGAYPMKSKDDKFPLHLGSDESGCLIQDGDYLRLQMGPTGFMCIKRNVLEKVREKESLLIEYTGEEGKKEWNFFHCGTMDGQWWGEDTAFCRKVAKHGFQIWCYTDVTFRHWGTKAWQNNCKEFLENQTRA